MPSSGSNAENWNGVRTMDAKKILQKLERYKYPLLVLLVGVLLMLLPGGIRSPTGAQQCDEDFAALISRIDGVGESRLALSESGVVVVCEGAERRTCASPCCRPSAPTPVIHPNA